jgi:hypothetical protein
MSDQAPDNPGHWIGQVNAPQNGEGLHWRYETFPIAHLNTENNFITSSPNGGQLCSHLMPLHHQPVSFPLVHTARVEPVVAKSH